LRATGGINCERQSAVSGKSFKGRTSRGGSFETKEDSLAFQKHAINARLRHAKLNPITPHDALAATGNGMCQKAPGRPLSAMKIETRKNPAVAAPTPSQYVNPKVKKELPLIICRQY